MITKADLADWTLAAELSASYSRVIIQGQGSGVARDEWWVDDGTALNGNVRELLAFASPGATLAQLKDQSEADLARLKVLTKLLSATVIGGVALTLRPGDRLAIDLDHGWAQLVSDMRALLIEPDGTAGTATLHLEAVT